METALADSHEHEVLSLEEVEELKRELEVTKTRTEAAKRKLKLESKLHDAAQSLNRLYSTKGRKPSGDKATLTPKTHRRGLMSSISSSGSVGRRDSSSSDLLNKTDDEMSASTRKCEELAQDIRQSEERAQQLERRLLEHTAGILHMTHRGLEKDGLARSRDGFYSIGFPTSKEESSQALQLHDFDSRSLYRPIEPIDEFEDDIYDSGNREVNGHGGPLGPALSQRLLEQAESIKTTEQKLQDLNERLKSSISHVNWNSAALPRRQDGIADDVDTELYAQLDQLEGNLDAILNHHSETTHAAERKISTVAKSLGDANTRLYSIITRSGQVRGKSVQHPSPPQMYEEGFEEGFEEQLDYLGFGLDALTQDIQQLSENADAQSVRETALEEQKDNLIRQIQQQRDSSGKGDAQKEVQMSGLQAELELSKTNFGLLEREASGTREELAIVTEQFEAARQDAALKEKEKGMNNDQALVAEREVWKDTEEHLLAELQAKQDRMAQLQEDFQDFQDNAKIAQAELQSQLEESERRMQKAMAEMEAAKAAQANEASLKQLIMDKTEELEKVHNDMQDMESQLVRLQTEATVARAELDGAYGTRAQRAAEFQSNPALEAELDEITARNNSLLEEIAALKAQLDVSGNGGAELAQHVENLKRELSETIAEYEVMTQASIEFEKEREQLEGMVDSVRDRCESLESQLSDERLKWLGIRSPGAASNRDSMVPGTTSTMVLKNEFKKMMRETRAENMKALRVRDLTCNLWLKLTVRIV